MLSRKQEYVDLIEESLEDRGYQDIEVFNTGRGIRASFRQPKDEGKLHFQVTGPDAEVFNFVEYFMPDDIHM